MKLFRNTKFPSLFNTYHEFKSLIHVLLFVACHLYMLQNVLGLYMLQNVLAKNITFIFWIHVMISHGYCYQC
jgi:hypothetical protein